MSSHQEDLDLLLSLQDRVLELPSSSPSNLRSSQPGYLPYDGSPRQRGQVDMSAFGNVVQDCLDCYPKPVEETRKPKLSENSNDPEVEKFSGLCIRNRVVTPAELSERFSEIRFVQLSTIKTGNSRLEQFLHCSIALSARHHLINLSCVDKGKWVNKETILPGRQITNIEKRKPSTVKPDPSVVINEQPDTNRKKTDHGQPLADGTKMGTGKMIELDIVSSDEEI